MRWLLYYLKYFFYLLQWIPYFVRRGIKTFTRTRRSQPRISPQVDPSAFPQYHSRIPTFKRGTVLVKTYQIEEAIGRGGFGLTYRASNIHQFNKPCVVKEFKPIQENGGELRKAQQLFEREAQILAELDHPQIPKFQAYFSISINNQNYWLLVQEWLEGKTLKEWIEKGQFSEDDVRSFLTYILPVLTYLHNKNIYHRDISPDNIILGKRTKLPHLIDFGGVKKATVSALYPHTNSETILHKRGYSPPEQYRDQCFPSSDLYALGVTVVAMLTRNLNPEELRDPNTWDWEWRSHVQTSVSPLLEATIDRMLMPNPNDRFRTARDVEKALKFPSPKPKSHKSAPLYKSTPPQPTAPTVRVGSPPSEEQLPRRNDRTKPTRLAYPPISETPPRPVESSFEASVSRNLSQFSAPPSMPLSPAQTLATQPRATQPDLTKPPKNRNRFVTWVLWLLAILAVILIPLLAVFWAVSSLLGG